MMACWLGLGAAALVAACGSHEERAPLLPGSRGGLVRIQAAEEEGLLEIDAFRGHVLLLDFWAPWSAPSRASLPALGRMHETMADRSFSVIGMTIAREVTPELQAEIEALALPYPVVLSNESVNRRMGAGRTIPTRVLLGRDGAVLRVYRGWAVLDQLRADVEHALQGEPLPPAPAF